MSWISYQNTEEPGFFAKPYSATLTRPGIDLNSFCRSQGSLLYIHKGPVLITQRWRITHSRAIDRAIHGFVRSYVMGSIKCIFFFASIHTYPYINFYMFCGNTYHVYIMKDCYIVYAPCYYALWWNGFSSFYMLNIKVPFSGTALKVHGLFRATKLPKSSPSHPTIESWPYFFVCVLFPYSDGTCSWKLCPMYLVHKVFILSGHEICVSKYHPPFLSGWNCAETMSGFPRQIEMQS